MITANCFLIVGEKGSTTPKTYITPAEALILAVMHSKNAGCYPLKDLKVNEGEVALQTFTVADHDDEGKPIEKSQFRPRTIIEEKRRLIGLYGKKIVAELFPGAKPEFPADFDEARELSIDVETKDAEEDDAKEAGELFGTREEAIAAAKKARATRAEVGLGDGGSPSDD